MTQNKSVLVNVHDAKWGFREAEFHTFDQTLIKVASVAQSGRAADL